MWDVTKIIGDLHWHITHDDVAEAKWLAENKPELWEKVAKGYNKWSDANAVLVEVKQALSERNT